MNAPLNLRKIPAEWTGLARQFYREVEAEHVAVVEAFDSLCKPYFDRMVRYPRRKLREGEFRRFADACEALPSKFRLSFVDKVDRRGRAGRFTDIRVQTARLEDPDWAEGAFELSLLLVLHTVSAPLVASLPRSAITLATVGLHALARRYQRGRDRSHRAILLDFADLLINADSTLPEGAEFRAAAGNGAWLGYVEHVDMVDPTGLHSGKQLVVRTFIVD